MTHTHRVLVLAAALLAAGAPGRGVRAQEKETGTPKLTPVVVQADYVAVSRPARDIRPVQVPDTGERRAGRPPRKIRTNPELGKDQFRADRFDGLDGALQSTAPSPAMPAPSLTFEGFAATDNTPLYGFTVNPPDTDGDVGPNHYVPMVNLVWGVYSKAGARLAGPLKVSQLWASAGFTDKCATEDDGDPIVLYDEYADRWILSQFAYGGGSVPYFECVAISRTPDPAGQYYLYSFQVPNAEFPDYPKIGVWPDAYYMTVNQFTNLGPFNGTGAYAFERERMLRGDPAARLVYFNLNLASFPEAIGGALPSDADGLRPPPPGMPNIFAYFTATEFSDPADGLRLFNFHVDWANPAASTFTERPESTYAAPLIVAPFNPNTPSGRADVIQPNGQGVDAIADRLMHRMQYRNFGTHQSLVTNHTVNVSGGTTLGTYRSGVRYYELRKTGGGNFVVREQATFAPGDGLSRWMGSAAMDAAGNLAVGYSTSGAGAAEFPSVAYAGRLAGDPLGGLFQGEAVMFGGLGSQSGSGNRWGDYSAMVIDPADDCTFWYTNEYYPAGSTSFNWRTRIGKFTFGPGTCTTPARGTVNVNVAACVGGAPVPGAAIAVDGVLYGTTGTGGTFSTKLAPGTYTVTASRPDLSTATGTAVVVAGGTATLNLCLRATPIIGVQSAVLTAEGCGTPNGAVDPGEPVTYALTLRNTGLTASSSLAVALLPGPNVTSPSGPQNYGVIPPGGSATRSFSWTAVGTCGNPWVATFGLNDAGEDLPALTIGDVFGALVTTTVGSQNFDGVTAPALPPGWVASNPVAGDGVLWVTAAATPDTPPNAAFVTEPAVISDKLLDAPPLAMPATGAFQLAFRSRYQFETGYDGGVLEVSVGGGAFTDILAAGGAFVSGGYTHTISSSFGNPLAGRQAWSGSTSNAYIDTVINLPPAFAGQNIRFRFRMASDTSVSGAGWLVDTIRVVSQARTCAVCEDPPNLVVSKLTAPAAAAPGATITIKSTTANYGAGSAVPSTTRFWLSTNKTLGGDTLLGGQAIGPLPPGGFSATSTGVRLPATVGSFYLIAQADGGEDNTETNETDNLRTKAITIGPDLYVSKLLFAPDPPTRTGTVISVTTKNKGGQTTGVVTVTRVFRSLNATLDPSDTLLGTIGVPVLGPGATSTGTLSPTLPAGTYYIIVVVDADNDVVEAKEGTANQKKVKKTVL